MTIHLTHDVLARRSALASDLRYGSHATTARNFAMADSVGASKISIPFPRGLAPIPQPSVQGLSELPKADVIVMADTDAEAMALADVMTPGNQFHNWHKYTHNYSTFAKQIGARGPSRRNHMLGSYMMTTINDVKVLCYKTELHMHEDAEKLADGSFSLPIKDVLKQMVNEAQPKLFLSTGTAGGVYPQFQLGDVMVSRAAEFYCKKDFGTAIFNRKTFKSDWPIPTKEFATAEALIKNLSSHLTGKTPPNPHCGCSATGHDLAGGSQWIHCDGEHGIPAFHPILTTDYFEFGTDGNDLFKDGMAVEMDDACLGLACSELEKPPHWACVRNVSDPVINSKLDEHQQEACAEFYYTHYGYWTTVNSSIVAWAIIAGM